MTLLMRDQENQEIGEALGKAESTVECIKILLSLLVL